MLELTELAHTYNTEIELHITPHVAKCTTRYTVIIKNPFGVQGAPSRLLELRDITSNAFDLIETNMKPMPIPDSLAYSYSYPEIQRWLRDNRLKRPDPLYDMKTGESKVVGSDTSTLTVKDDSRNLYLYINLHGDIHRVTRHVSNVIARDGCSPMYDQMLWGVTGLTLEPDKMLTCQMQSRFMRGIRHVP